MEADRVRDVPKRRRRIVDAECVGEIQTAELPGLGSRLNKLRRDGRLDHRPRPMPAGAAQLQVGAGECAVAARREQELEHLPRRTVDRDPRLDVRAEHPQQPVAIQRLQRLRFVAPNRQRVVSEHPSLLRGRENARENRRQAHSPPVASRNGAIPRSTWNSGCPEPRPASAPIHRRRSHGAAGIQAGMTARPEPAPPIRRSANQAGRPDRPPW